MSSKISDLTHGANLRLRDTLATLRRESVDRKHTRRISKFKASTQMITLLGFSGSNKKTATFKDTYDELKSMLEVSELFVLHWDVIGGSHTLFGD